MNGGWICLRGKEHILWEEAKSGSFERLLIAYDLTALCCRYRADHREAEDKIFQIHLTAQTVRIPSLPLSFASALSIGPQRH